MRNHVFQWTVLTAFTGVLVCGTECPAQQSRTPSGFHKPLIQNRPQRVQPTRPSSGPHVRPHNAQRGYRGYRGGYYGPGYVAPYFGPGFGWSFGVPFRGFNYGVNGIDIFVPPTGRAFYQSEFYGPLPAPVYPSLNESNAAQAQRLLDRVNGRVPSAPIPDQIPPGLSIANKTTVPTDAQSKSNQLIAEAAFRNRNYPAAASQVAQAISRDRDNGYLWQFSSQVHLANGKFTQAAQDAGLAMKLTPRKDWFWIIEQFREFYRNDDYVTQMKRLSEHIKLNPRDVPARNLRAYHFLGLGYPNEAMTDLNAAKAVSPNDEWTQTLINYVQPILAQPKTKPILEPPKPEALDTQDRNQVPEKMPNGKKSILESH